MGTRNLTMVIHNQQTKIAQYGQWDGYPEGQGATILEFMRSVDMDRFKDVLSKVRFSTEEDDKEVDSYLNGIGSKDGWMTSEQADLFNKQYPFTSRNHGGEILELIYNSDIKEIVLNNAEDFAGDGLFCEFAYVVDLDKNELEVYTGYGKKALSEEDRFFYLTKDKDKENSRNDYSPVKIIKSYSLSDLPDNETFVNELNSLLGWNEDDDSGEEE